jgi:Na+/melibiose symporter-like transporter
MVGGVDVAEADAAHPGARRLSLPTRFFYGFGSVAFGVKDNGFSYFLQFFYAQVMGLPSATVGLAIMFALVIDAFVDPVVGQLSDNLRSRWGRRHPFMYAAALPVGLSYLLLWNPPHGWSQGALVAYLMLTAILIRSFITCYEVPSSALAAELTSHYDERTRLLSYRYLFGWIGGLTMYFLALTVFLKPGASGNVGQLNPLGYAHYGVFAGGLMIFAILTSAIGTHGQIPYLREPPHARMKLGRLARELVGAMAHRTFLFILSASFFNAMAIGLGFSINLYFTTYFWEFSSQEIALFTFSSLAAALLAFWAAPRIASRVDKKPAAMALIAVQVVFIAWPLVARLAGVFVSNESPLIFPIIFINNIAAVGTGIAGNILFSSMIADVAEDSELRTGRRQEGVFFAAALFVQKAVTGAGIFVTGLIVGLIHFPQGVRPGTVPAEVLRNLGLVYLPVAAGLYGMAVLLLLGYRITRKGHQETLRRLAAAADLATEGEPPSMETKLS